MIKEEHKQFIKDNLPFFNQLTDSEQKLLFSSVYYNLYTKQTIMHSGQSDCAGLFLIKSGQLRAFIVSESGKQLTVYRLFEYDVCIFSANCILKNIDFDILVEASIDSEIFIIPSTIYNRLMNENMKVLEFTNHLISSRFSEVMWIAEQTIFSSFDKRLSSFLLEQINIEDSNNLNITHEEIAKHLASAREVVTRMLKYFQNENILRISRGKIEIIDINKLRKIAN